TGRFGIDWKPTAKFDNYTMVYGTNSANHGPGSINENVSTPELVAAQQYYWTLTGGLVGCSPGGATSCANAAAYYNAAGAQAKALGPRADALALNEYDTIHTYGVTNTSRY